MLEIKNSEGLALQLPPDQRLTVEINSTIFDTDDVIRGSYSYPFKFPLNENNRRFIGHGHLPESPLLPDMQVNVRAGAHAFVATLTYKTSGLYADGALLIDLGELADKIRNVPVREFVTETFLITQEPDGVNPTFLDLAQADPGRYPVVFPPFINDQFIEEGFVPADSEGKEDKGYKKPVHLNAYDLTTGKYAGVQYGDGGNVMVPMVYLGWLLRYICNKLGFSTHGSFFSDQRLKHLVLFSNQSIPGCDAENGKYTVMLGRHLNDGSIADLFKSLRAYFGMSVEVNVTTGKVSFITYASLRQLSGYVDLSTAYVPGTSGIEIPNKEGYTIKTNLDDVEKNIYRAYTVDEFSFALLATTPSFSTGKGNRKPVQLEIGTLHMIRNAIPGTGTGDGPKWLLPKSTLPGNLADPFFKDSNNYAPYTFEGEPERVPEQVNSYGYALLLYMGMRPATNGMLYPYATSLSYDSKYNIIGDLSLKAGEPDDVWTRYQKAYYEFITSSKQVTAAFRLSLSQLNSIKPYEPIAFRLENHVLGKYLLKKLSYELPATGGYVMAELEAVQLSPKVLKTDSEAVANVWFQVRLENRRTQQVGDVFNDYYDVVFYLWKDGAYATPSTNEHVLVNYLYSTFLRRMDGTRLPRIDETKSITLSEHRTVIEENKLLTIYGPADWRKWKSYTYYAMNGRGYRVR